MSANGLNGTLGGDDRKPDGKPLARRRSGENNARPEQEVGRIAPSTPYTEDAAASAIEDTAPPAALPFLVTNWLASLDPDRGNGIVRGFNSVSDSQQKREAYEKIRHATKDLARAFSALGAFGRSHQPNLTGTVPLFSSARQPQNSTYSDVKRKWDRNQDTLLPSLVHAAEHSSRSGGIVASNLAKIDAIAASREAYSAKTVPRISDGRSAQGAIDIASDKASDLDTAFEEGVRASTALHTPLIIDADDKLLSAPPDFGFQESAPSIPVRSQLAVMDMKASSTMRELLDVQGKVLSNAAKIQTMEASLLHHIRAMEDLKAARSKFESDLASSFGSSPSGQLDWIGEEEQNCTRVMAQLRRSISEQSNANESQNLLLKDLKRRVRKLHTERLEFLRRYIDPFYSLMSPKSTGCRIGNNPVVRHMLRRAGNGGDLPPRRESDLQQTVLTTRLSLSATINTHLQFPVYCLRFDRTGRFFVTGADDYLIKLFCLGAGRLDSGGSKAGIRGFSYGSNMCGAVLVCTLRGHAGVINDIDVSSDNCFLATASVDGDVRIWGLKDGSPVAILRGHKGGANMVSWSKSTPYRVLTTSADGFARMWDIREATLKRYGAIVGKRPEYNLILLEDGGDTESNGDTNVMNEGHYDVAESLPRVEPIGARDAPLPLLPLPPGQPNAGSDTSLGNAAIENAGSAVNVLVPGPLAGVSNNNGGPGAAAIPQNVNNQINTGQFVANDMIDEGVVLLRKFQHGSSNEFLTGPGTRARQSSVNVICVARCPSGEHFATGSDDGICRVWYDENDDRVEMADNVHFPSEPSRATRRPKIDFGNDPIFKLTGHVNAVTDIAYSHAGGRILSASQRDGVIRIWSLPMYGTGAYRSTGASNDGSVTQIVIKLIDPWKPEKKSRSTRRKGPGGSAQPPAEASKVSCDVAVWTCDDSFIISSQSILVKQSGTDIQPGSQFMFLWDSTTGHCLMGISGAHSMQCPVVLPHPDNPFLVCSAGADGLVNIWDWKSGSSVFSYENRVEFGPVDPAERNKLSGFLDGAFGKDGVSLVLTDDCGRVTIFDSSDKKAHTCVRAPIWMREQYFGNDYYDLVYDANGYAVERGSALPPHLAPKGSRCNHGSHAWDDDVTECFQGISGPLPLAPSESAWRREQIRQSRRRKSFLYDPTQDNKARRGIREFDKDKTIIFHGPAHVSGLSKSPKPSSSHRDISQPGRTRSTSEGSRPRLSSNYNWRDYDDLEREQGNGDDDPETEDEEFVDPGNRIAGTMDDDDDDSVGTADETSVSRTERTSTQSNTRSRRSNPQAENERLRVERSQRAQRRSRRGSTVSEMIPSDDEEDINIQFVTTNRTPKGPYIKDYTVHNHFWQLPPHAHVKRKWLCRIESDSSYSGRKAYAPQVGDSVVYIPSAHNETLKDFPSHNPPWQSFPQESTWPVVLCKILAMRPRFPYEDYFAKEDICKSIIAVLTLKVIGVPDDSEEQEFPWPSPSFVDPPQDHCFEVGVMDNDRYEFVIPKTLYMHRLQALENAIRTRGNTTEGLEIILGYARENKEDAELQIYGGKIKYTDEPEAALRKSSLQGSGFGSVMTECDNHEDTFSPWEVVVDETVPIRPSLTEQEIATISSALDTQQKNPAIGDVFSGAVDESKYYDYSRMVEIQMNIYFIKRRLAKNYYSNKFSVISDVKLIRDNSIKYNSAEADLSKVAIEMYENVKKDILSPDELGQCLSDEELIKIVDDSSHKNMKVAAMFDAIKKDREEQIEKDRENPAIPKRQAQSKAKQPSILETLLPSSPRRSNHRRSDVDLPDQRRSTRLRDNFVRRQSMTSESASSWEHERPLSGARRSTRSSRPAVSYEESSVQLSESESAVSGRRVSFGSARSSEAVAVDPSTNRRTNGHYGLRSRDSAQSVASNTGTAAKIQVPAGFRSSKRTRSEAFSSAQTDEFCEEETKPSARKKQTTRTRSQSNLSGVEGNEPDVRTRTRLRISMPRANSPVTPPRRTRNSLPMNESDSELGSDTSHSSNGDSASPDDWEQVQTPPITRKLRVSQRKNRQTPSAKVLRTSRANSKRAPRASPAKSVSPTRKSYRNSAATSYKEESSDSEIDNEKHFLDGDVGNNYSSRVTRAQDKQHHDEELSESGDEGDDDGDDSSSQTDGLPSPEPILPPLEEWPRISTRYVNQVAHDVVERVRILDPDDIFAQPVIETVPHLRDEYLTEIETPMDLNTILCERIPSYQSIGELQQDLIIMLENCCQFNRSERYFIEYSRGIHSQLDDIFKDVCAERGIRIQYQH